MATFFAPARTDSTITLSNSNKTGTANSSPFTNNAQTNDSAGGGGKYYWEILVVSTPSSNISFGTTPSGYATNTFLGQTSSVNFDLQGNGGAINGNSITWTGTIAAGDRMCFALDGANNLIHMRVNNGSWQNSGNPSAGTGGYAYTVPNPCYPAIQLGISGDSATLASSPAEWGFSAPSGFVEVGPVSFIPRLTTLFCG